MPEKPKAKIYSEEVNSVKAEAVHQLKKINAAISENTPDQLIIIKNKTVIIAPFYDELHNANYE